MGMHVAVACPGGYAPPTGVTVSTHETARQHGGSVRVTSNVQDAVAGAHAIYTDVWVSMGQDGQSSRRLTELAGYQVNSEVMAYAAPEAVFMHCLPAHRGQEVTAEVIDGPRSVVFAQAANRLPTEQAVLHTLIEGSLRCS